MSLTEIAIKRPSLIVVIFTVLTFLGYISYYALGYELLPKMDFPVFNVMTIYPGASPSEVENSVTKKIEDAVASLESIENIRSYSQEGVSLVFVQLKPGTKSDKSMQDAQRKVNAIIATLPKDIRTPSINKISFSEMPIIRIGITATLPPTELYDIVKQRVQPAISKIGGVGQLSIVGGEEREIRVNIDAKKLEAYRVSIMQVRQAIQSSNMDFPTGKIKTSENQNIIRLAGKFRNLRDLENVVIATDDNGSPIQLSKVAEVQDTQKEAESIMAINQENAIGLMLIKQSDANAVQVKEDVLKELESLEKEFKAQGVHFEVAQDTTVFTMEAAEAVMHDLGIAIILVAAVMLLFLHSFRNAVIVMIAIPASLVTTFIGMYILGFTLNLMTLLALSLVVGILVDDSIVVLENIQRHLEMGKDKRTASLDGRNEIGFTAMSITLVDVVVFLPISLVDGIIANIMRQFCLVVVVSTLMSLFVSFTITPLLASRFAKLEHLTGKNPFSWFLLMFERALDAFTHAYADVLRWCLKNIATRITVLTVTIVLFFSSFLLVTQGYIGGEFVAMGDQGEFIINVELPKDAILDQTNKITQQVEKELLKYPEITKVITSVGASSSILEPQGSAYKSEINVKMVPKEERNISSDFMANKVKNDLTSKIPGAKIQTSQMSIMGGANDAPIQIIFRGSDTEVLYKYAEKIKALAKKVPGASSTKLTVETGNPEINVNLDKRRMAELGLSMDMVGGVMQTAFSGYNDSKFKPDVYEYDINVKLDAFDRKNVDDLASLIFVNNRGEQVKLSQFAQISQTTGAARLERRSRVSAVTLESQVIGRPVGTVGGEMLAIVDQNPMPKGVSMDLDGDLKMQGDAAGSMGTALMASILFVYLIMVALYDSYIYPFVVLFSIPVAMIGALLALALTMQSLNIFSGLGMIMLIGLVAKNAILLVDFATHRKKEGATTFDALIESGQTRLRPILMTTVAMVIGMLPLALASGAGAEWKNGLAWVLIGGLTSSMFLTLLVVPVMYQLTDYTIALVGKLVAMIANRNSKNTPTSVYTPKE
ncbi:MAG: efflux RND transporter permease subunit [Bacteroidetes bacterium]|nr:MAG: efflux RND transporter permease subunit [Bacteroidota bacterium]